MDDLIIRLAGGLVGLWLFIHFTCRAAFLPRSAPSIVAVVIALVAGAGAFTFMCAVFNKCLLAPLFFALSGISVYDLIIWIMGFKLSKFFEVKK